MRLDFAPEPLEKSQPALTSSSLSPIRSEAASVVSFLHDQLNLTAAADAGPWDNIITAIDLAVPNKTESLSYLDGNQTAPGRFAVASIMFNTDVHPYLEDWIVGPLPISNDSTAQPYSFRSTKGSSKIRNHDADSDKVEEFVKTITEPMDDIVEYLLGAKSESFDIWGIVSLLFLPPSSSSFLFLPSCFSPSCSRPYQSPFHSPSCISTL